MSERAEIAREIRSRAKAMRNQAAQLERDSFQRLVLTEKARAWEELAKEIDDVCRVEEGKP